MSRRSLLEALLSEEDYQRLYTEHTGFHFAVDGLLNMLPGLVAGMAGQALEDESRRVAQLQQLRDQPAQITWSATSAPEPAPELPRTFFEEDEPVEEIQAAFEAKPARRRTSKPASKPAKRAVKKTARRR